MEQKLSDFYKLAMDSVRRNREGVAPVKPILDEMEAARTVADLAGKSLLDEDSLLEALQYRAQEKAELTF